MNEKGTSGDSMLHWKSVLLLAVVAGSLAGGRELRRRWHPSSASAVTPHAHGNVSHDQQFHSQETSAQGPAISRGELLYGQHCSKCHGEAGQGDGEGLRPFTIRPRDFRSEHWKLPKTLSSIEQVIRNGITGSPMPGFGHALSTSEITTIAQHVLKLGQRTSDDVARLTDSDVLLQNAGFSPVIPGRIPRLRLIDGTSTERDLSQIVSGPAIIHFWGTTCVHCISEFPELNQIAEELRMAGVPLLSLCGDETDPQAVAHFANDFPQLDLYADPTGLAMNRFSATLLPTLFLVDADSQVIGVSHRALSRDQLPAIVRAVSTTNGASLNQD